MSIFTQGSGYFWTRNSLQRNKITSVYEPTQPFFLFHLCQHVKIKYFIDAGANIGFYSIFFSSNQEIKHIYAFEASAKTHSELLRNVEINDIKSRITCAPIALSDNSGELSFNIYESLSGRNCVSTTSIYTDSDSIEMQTVKCDTIDNQINIEEKFIALKIDVEGHELEVLRGALNLLKKNKCLIQIESFKPDEVFYIMNTLGYKSLGSIKHDHYFTNINISTEDVLCALQNAVSDSIDNNRSIGIGARQTGTLSVNVTHVSSNVISVFLEGSSSALHGDLEYAFELISDGKKTNVAKYSQKNIFEFDLNPFIKSKNLRVRGFARERDCPDKVLMVVTSIAIH